MSGKLGEAVQQIMKTEMAVTDLARQFPAAAPALRQAVDGLRQAGTGLRAALRQVMTQPGQPEPPAPNIGG
jgi:transposase-like protein